MNLCTFRVYLQLIEKGTETLSTADAVLVKEAQPLNRSTISHEVGKGGDIRGRVVPDGREARGRSSVLADAVALRSLELVTEDPRVKELRRLRVGGVLQDGACLRPADKGYRSAGRHGGRDVEAVATAEAEGGREGGGLRLVGGHQDGARSRGAADPARVLSNEAVEPFLSKAVDTGGVV